MSPEHLRYVRRALTHPYHLLALAIALGLAAFEASGWPLVAALGAELVYLTVVPASAWFRRGADADDEAERRDEARARRLSRVDGLSPAHAPRHAALEALADQARDRIDAHDPAARALLAGLADDLDQLLERSLDLAEALDATDARLADPSALALDAEASALDAEAPASPDARAALRARRAAVQARRDALAAARERREALAHELRTVEHLLALAGASGDGPALPERLRADVRAFLQDLLAADEAAVELSAAGAEPPRRAVW